MGIWGVQHSSYLPTYKEKFQYFSNQCSCYQCILAEHQHGSHLFIKEDFGQTIFHLFIIKEKQFSQTQYTTF